jgi:hypothetical protein
MKDIDSTIAERDQKINELEDNVKNKDFELQYLEDLIM